MKVREYAADISLLVCLYSSDGQSLVSCFAPCLDDTELGRFVNFRSVRNQTKVELRSVFVRELL